MPRLLLVVLTVLTTSCVDVVAPPRVFESMPGVQVKMAFARVKGLYDAPWPSDDLRDAAGHVSLQALPNPDKVALVEQAIQLIEARNDGFSNAGAIFVPLTGAITPTALPDLPASTKVDAAVYVMGLTPLSPDFKKRVPVQVQFQSDGGPFGAANLLTVLPLQGRPLRPGELYMVLVLRKAGGMQLLGVAPEMAALASNHAVAGLNGKAAAGYATALKTLDAIGTAREDLAGLAVYTTGRPTADGVAAAQQLAFLAPPKPEKPFAKIEEHADFCVYHTTIVLPDFQSGVPPYSTTGGGWQFDGAGKLIQQKTIQCAVFATVPKSKMPQTGYPAAVFVRTGGGGDRPLIDRGVQPQTGATALEPGEGPARYFARAGYVGLQIDGPLGGLRNVTKSDEQFLVFNVANPTSLRDTIRESALELALFAQVAVQLQIPIGDCAGTAATQLKVDSSHLALMGHSTGAWIAQIAMALQPLYGAVILSGSGGSYIENVLWKKKPLDVLPLAEAMLGFVARDRPLTQWDPALTVVQWAAEPSDPQVYTPPILVGPQSSTSLRHVLMQQGIVDHYIMPSIANGTSLAFGLDLAGPALDYLTDEFVQAKLQPLAYYLPLVQRGLVDYPVTGNRKIHWGGAQTAVVTQHKEDGVQDGHETVFQTTPPKLQYQCFLKTWRLGVPTVIGPAMACP